MASLNARIGEVTERIRRRSQTGRSLYMERLNAAAANRVRRDHLSCSNLAHGFAACAPGDKASIRAGNAPNLAIITAYNDMLSAHQPYERFPELIREAARKAGGTAQVAGGVPAMCDGVTQGQTGMEMSLFSRDTIAMAAAVGLSHDMFDAAVFLGICDKIVPGLLIAALTFGHLPAVFIPAGPMPSGLPNPERAKARQLYAERKITREELLEVEAKSYHAPGTCTFYGTANSNQMLMEIMGLHLPGASFINPNTPLRDALTRLAVTRALAITSLGNEHTPVGTIIDERAIVNGVVGLNATGGSTNHTLHLVAAARAAGITLTWDDFHDISEAVPLLARVYPNGSADVNQFHQAGGMQFLMRELLGAGLLHEDVKTVWGTGLNGYLKTPELERQRRPRLDGRQEEEHGREDPRTGQAAVPAGGRPAAAHRQPRPRGHQGVGGQRRAPGGGGAGDGVRFAGGAPRGLPRRQAQQGLRRGHPLPGPARQRHAGAAQADADAGRSPGPRLQGGADHRRAHVRRFRQGAGGDPRHAGSGGRRRARPHPRRRRHPAGRAGRPPRRAR